MVQYLDIFQWEKRKGCMCVCVRIKCSETERVRDNPEFSLSPPAFTHITYNIHYLCNTHILKHTHTPLTWVLQSLNVRAHLLLEYTLASWRDTWHTELSYLAVASSLAGGKQVDQPKHTSQDRCVHASSSYITR